MSVSPAISTPSRIGPPAKIGPPPKIGLPAVIGLASLSASAFVAVTVEALPTGLLPQLGAGLGVDQATAGALVSVYAIVVALASLPLVALTAGLPRKPLLMGTVAAYAASSLTIALTHSFTVALGGRVVGGLAHALFFAVAAAYPVRLVPAHVVGRAVAAIIAGGSVALLFGVPLGTAIGTAWGWRTAFLLLAGLGVVLLAVTAVALPAAASTAPTTSAREVVRLLKAPGLLQVAVVSTLAFGAQYTAFTFISPLLQRGGIATAHVAAVLLVYGIGGLVGVALAGTFADRRARPLLLTCLSLLTVVLVAVWSTDGPALLTAGIALVWGLASGVVPTLTMSAGVRVGHDPDMSAAVINGACNLGIAAGSTLGSLVVSRLGVHQAPLIGALVCAAALIAAVRARVGFRSAARPVQIHEPVPA